MGYQPPRRRSILPTLFLGSGLLTLGGLGTTATLWGLGHIDLPFLKRPGPAAPTFEGMVMVPASARVIPAYAKVTRDDLFDRSIMDWKTVPASPDAIKKRKIFVNPQDLFGRVLSHEKPAGYAFTEDDLLPPGTRPGLVGGIPPGKRALNLEAEKIKGIQTLKLGDRFDLLSSLPVDDKKTPKDGTLKAGLFPEQQKRARVRPIVQNAMIVSPVEIRQVPISAPSRKGGPPQTKPVQEIVIALDPEEIPLLTEALSIGAEVVCVARSGHPEDPGEEKTTPGTPPPPPRRVVEIIEGDKRQMIEYPVAPQEPQAKGQAPGQSAPPPVTRRLAGADPDPDDE